MPLQNSKGNLLNRGIKWEEMSIFSAVLFVRHSGNAIKVQW